MDQALSYLLTLVLLHGYPIVLLAMCLGYLGVPIPLNALLLAAGAFTADGTLNVYVLIPLVVITAITGDIIGYMLGKKFGFLMVNSYTTKIGLTQKRFADVNVFLQKWGGGSIFLTRWLITPLGIPVNFMAGINHYPFKIFLFWVIIGEVLWTCLYVFIGRAFGANWVTLLEYIDDLTSFFASLTIGVGSLMIGYKLWRKHLTSRRVDLEL